MVRVTRARHPMEDRVLAVFSASQRRGRRFFTLILPDQSRTLIPADWTDAADRANEVTPSESTSQRLGSMADLLRTRRLVDALSGRHLQAEHHLNQERPRATTPTGTVDQRTSASSTTSDLSTVEPRTSGPTRADTGPSHRPHDQTDPARDSSTSGTR